MTDTEKVEQLVDCLTKNAVIGQTFNINKCFHDLVNDRITIHDHQILNEANRRLVNLYKYATTSGKGSTYPQYKLTELGETVVKAGGHFKYQEDLKTKEQTAEIKLRLEIQKLQSENIKLANEIIDYPIIKRQRNILFVTSIIMLLIAAATVILKIADCK